MSTTRIEYEAAAELVALEKPAEVIRAAAVLMQARFAADGFVWIRSRKTLERRYVGRLETVRCESSRWNRAGSLIEFVAAAVDVRDDVLLAWRRAHPDLTVERPASVEGIVAAASLYDIPDPPRLFLTRPESRVAHVEVFCDRLRDTALPWLATTADPAHLVDRVPDALLAPWGFALDLVEFLVSRNERTQAVRFIERFLALGPTHQAAFEEGRELARRGEKPRWHTAPTLGWSSVVLALV